MQNKKVYTFTTAMLALILLYSFCSTVYYVFIASLSGFYSFSTSIPALTGIAGLIIFWLSKFKKSRLLKVYLSFEIFAIPFIAYSYFRMFFPGASSAYYTAPELTPMLLLNMAITFLLVSCSAILLWFLSKEQQPSLIYFKDGNETIASFSPATAGNRFTNRLVDAIIMIVFMSNVVAILEVKSISTETYLVYLIAEVPMTIVYYLVFESFFKTTAGKCATNTIVVNERGERPSFVQILGRTFCRLIPFEAFSFFQ